MSGFRRTYHKLQLRFNSNQPIAGDNGGQACKAVAEINALLKREVPGLGAEIILRDDVRDFHYQGRLRFAYDRSHSTRKCVMDILAAARLNGKERQVAEYLIGATLKLRFPEKHIENRSSSLANTQRDCLGCFLLGTAAIYVVSGPMSGLFKKCQENINDHIRPILLVSDESLLGIRQNAELNVSGPIEVESIESFVAQNVLEVAEFSSGLLPRQFLRLLEIYNERVDQIEIDKSMMIEIPQNLVRDAHGTGHGN